MNFCVEALWNALKHSQTSFWIELVRFDAFVAKLFPEVRYLEIVLSTSRYNFCMNFCVEGLGNATKHSDTSFWIELVRLDVFVAKLFPEVRYPEIVHSAPKHKFWNSFHAEGPRNALKHCQKSFFSNRLMDAFMAKLFPEVRYSRIVYSASKHNFCMNFCVEGLRNAPKHSQTSFWD